MSTNAVLHSTLKALMEAISAGDGDALRTHLADLDRHRDGLGAETPPMLQHYLEKRSYAKAIDFLEGRDEADAAPNC